MATAGSQDAPIESFGGKVSASEAYARGFSWGLMQLMGQVARETGFDAPFLSSLCDPEMGLAAGCRVLRRKFDAQGGDITKALLAWNGGATTPPKSSRAFPNICRGSRRRFPLSELPMPLRIWMKLAELGVTIALVTTILFAWEADRRDRSQLAAQLDTANAALAAATGHQHETDTHLSTTLASIAAAKSKVETPAQLAVEISRQLSLPQPIVIQTSQPLASALGTTPPVGAKDGIANQSTLKNGTGGSSASSTTTPPLSQAFVPAIDLKPLHDFTLDCQACKARLAAAQADLADEKTKTGILTGEKNDALKLAKGGSLLRRLARAAKWFALGAAAGAVAAKATR